MEKYQSISIMKAKKQNGAIIWVVTLHGNMEDPNDLTQKEFQNFNDVKAFIQELPLS